MPSSYPFCCKWQDFLLSHSWIIFHCVCVHVSVYTYNEKIYACVYIYIIFFSLLILFSFYFSNIFHILVIFIFPKNFFFFSNHDYFIPLYPSFFSSFSSVTQSCLTLCDPMNCSMPGLPVHHQPLEFTQTHVHRVGDIQPSRPLSSPSAPAPNPSQHQGLFQ